MSSEGQGDQATWLGEIVRLLNLSEVLAAAGASLADVVKTTIFYADVDDFARLDAVYARHMPQPPPARSAPSHIRLPL